MKKKHGIDAVMAKSKLVCNIQDFEGEEALCNNLRFKTAKMFMLHMTKVHNTGENLVTCEKCGYQTTTKRNLKRHNEWKHEEHQVCALCAFSGCKSSLTSHMKKV